MRRPFHKIGDIKTRIRFAWLPVNGTDGYRHWLCRVREVYEWQPEWRPRTGYQAIKEHGTPEPYGYWKRIKCEAP